MSFNSHGLCCLLANTDAHLVHPIDTLLFVTAIVIVEGDDGAHFGELVIRPLPSQSPAYFVALYDAPILLRRLTRAGFSNLS
jgi:hypothetical protein